MRRQLSKSGFALLLAGLAPASLALAQVEEKSQAIIMSAQSSDDGSPPVMNVQVMTDDGMGNVMSFASPIISDGAMGFAMPMMAGGDPTSMLSFDSVAQEIELVDDQRNQLNQIRKDFAGRLQEAMEGLRKGNVGPETARDIGERIKQVQEEQNKAIRQVLLPHQIERLEQVALQARMRAAGAAATLADAKLMEALGITDEQKEKIRTRAAEVAKELEEQIQALREKAREKLLQETLTPEQQDKLKKLLGAKFEGDLQPQMKLRRGSRNRDGADESGGRSRGGQDN